MPTSAFAQSTQQLIGPGDFDGDGRADLVVFRPGTGRWDTRPSSTGFTTATSLPFGTSGDVPVPGDYDGDGKTDLAVYRPSNGGWYILQSSTDFTTLVAYQLGPQRRCAGAGRLRWRLPDRPRGLSPVHRRLVHPDLEQQLHRRR